jgi:hypothetical protein
MLQLSRIQRNHLLKWLVIILTMEVILFFFPLLAWKALLALGVAFLIGFLLRILDSYPGKYEPPILDLLSGALALICGVGCFVAGKTDVAVRLFILLAPPFALVPHFVYIIRRLERAAKESERDQCMFSRKGGM